MAVLLPFNATEFERALEKVIHDRFEAIEVPIRDLWDADRCPVNLLPWLAWANGVDFWDDSWPTHVKRSHIRNAINVHRRKGTAKAVKDTVNSFGAGLVLTEWFENGGSPYTFDILMTMGGSTPADAEYQQQIIDAVNVVKNVRSSFTLNLGITAASGFGLQGAARAVVFTRLCFTAE